MFKRYLHAHHTAEDETVWPVMERLLAGPPDDLALLAAMESEHAAIDGLLGAVDAAIAPPSPSALPRRTPSAGRCDQRASPPIRLTEPDTITTPKT